MPHKSTYQAGSDCFVLRACLLVIMVVGPTHSAIGQERDSVLAVGDHIRVITSDSPTVFEGTLTKITNESLQLAAETEALHTLAVGEIESLYALVERENGSMGALTGVLIGGVIGGALGASATSGACEPDEFCVSPAGSGMGFLAGATLGSLMGLVVGRAIGMEIHTSSWQRVDLDVAVRPTYDTSAETRLEVRPSIRLEIRLNK